MKITLKNNKQITLKRIRAKDYDAMMIYLDKFTKGPSAKWTNQYPNQPKKDKQKSIEHYESENELFLSAWLNEEIIASGSIHLSNINHPYNLPKAEFGLTILEEYTSLGLGTILLKELEKWAIKKGVHRIQAIVRHNNKRALGLYLKQGYQIEGLLKETAFFDKEYQHEYLIAKIIPDKSYPQRA